MTVGGQEMGDTNGSYCPFLGFTLCELERKFFDGLPMGERGLRYRINFKKVAAACLVKFSVNIHTAQMTI